MQPQAKDVRKTPAWRPPRQRCPIRGLLGLCAAGAWLLVPFAAAQQAPVPEAVDDAGIQARFVQQQRLQLDFPAPMQTWHGDGDGPDVRITPELPARCTWTSDTRLHCGFDGRVPAAATRYRIELPAGLLTQAGQALPARTLTVDTMPPLLLANVAGWRDGVPVVELSATAPVTPDAIARVLRASVDGEALALAPPRALPRRERDRGHRFALALPEIAGIDRVLVLSVVPGLRSSEGPLPGPQSQVLLRAKVNEAFRLRGGGCQARDEYVSAQVRDGAMALACLPETPVHLVFSRQVDAASRQRLADLLPAGVRLRDWSEHRGAQLVDAEGHRLEARPGDAVLLEIERAEATAPIVLPAGALHATDGAQAEAVHLTFRTGAHRPRLQADRQRMLIGPGRGPPELARVYNAAALPMREQALAADWHAGRFQTPRAPGDAHRPIESDAARRALAAGGWVRWRPAEGPYRTRMSDLQFAAPDFDLFATAGRREVLVWANAWEGDTPMAGTEVELLWLQDADSAPRAVARGTTDGDGVVLLHLPGDMAVAPDDASGDAPTWMLHATRTRAGEVQRAVLPAWQVQRHGPGLGQAAPRLLWGVADRPLYRAGDTARYRLWQRQRSGGRLLAVSAPAPRMLRLLDQDQRKTILRWEAIPDAAGGFSGEVELPIHLTDGTYCIGDGEDHEFGGSCFFVGTYRAQDLWLEADTGAGVLREGDRFVVDVEAGYYSGGPGAGIALSPVSTRLNGLPLQQAYPQYAGYSFVDVFAAGLRQGVPLAGEPAATTDAQGRARIDLPVAFDGDASQLPAFGRLQLVAQARLGDRESTASNAVFAQYARYARYVGLRLVPGRSGDASWPQDGGAARLEAVVVTAAGEAVDAPVQVEVHYLPGDDAARAEAGDDAAAQLLARCAVPVGETAACEIDGTRPGRYTFIARSGDAAPAELTRHVWTGERARRSAQPPGLEIVQAPETAGVALQAEIVRLDAPTRALLVFAAGDRILGHQVRTVGPDNARLILPTDADWRGSATLHAYLRRSAPAGEVGKDGHRQAPPVAALEAEVPLPGPDDRQAPVTLAFATPAAAPGGRATLTVHNASDTAREVAVVVVDDALRALGRDFLAYFDPHGVHWLGASRHWRERLDPVSFAAWAQPVPWWLGLPWPDERPAAGSDKPAVVFDTPSAMDTPAPPPAPPAPAADIGSSVTTPLGPDTIQVTGTRIAGEEAARMQVSMRGLGPREADREGHALQALASVRTRFADTALWLPDLRLAPGESRTLEVALPDNLTRWRAIAWSSDADDDFHMVEAALETGLPVEVRLQTPVRLYPGDRTRLAANVRQTGDAPAEADAALQVDGLAAPLRDAQRLALPARGQRSIATEIAPQAEGVLQVLARAATGAGEDAVATRIEVASPFVDARRVQAGWLGETPLALTLPELPDGAADARLQVSLLPGASGLVTRWTQDLRAFTHRCWEQILSRAVAAALAIERGDTDAWPDAREVIDEALDNAAVFQAHAGDFRFFADGPTGYGPERRPQVALTAYSLQAFAVLRELGYRVDAQVEARARGFIDAHLDADGVRGGGAGADAVGANERAFALAALDAPRPGLLGETRARWGELSLPARIALAEAMARSGHRDAQAAVDDLLRQAPARGPARVLQATADTSMWMGSPMREQCALIGLLRAAPAGVDAAAARRALVAGLDDLYAGGVRAVDTQTGAVCLLALRDLAAADGGAIAVTLQPDTADAYRLALAPGQPRADWQGPLPADGRLSLQPAGAAPAPASYLAEVSYREDARQARTSSVGFAIERRFEVLRNGAWTDVGGAPVTEGDWLRITLTVRTGARRYFVAVTDAVPGGLQPTDLSLSGIAGLDLEAVSGEGSHRFGTRRLDPRAPRFYAESLPAGEHAIHYFARAGNAGDYLAAPATAELMYGSASDARTAAQRIGIEAGAPSR